MELKYTHYNWRAKGNNKFVRDNKETFGKDFLIKLLVKKLSLCQRNRLNYSESTVLKLFAFYQKGF